VFNILSLILPQPKQTEEEKKAEGVKEMSEVIDKLAYRHSIPQYIITDIVVTWMNYSHKRMGLE